VKGAPHQGNQPAELDRQGPDEVQLMPIVVAFHFVMLAL
jgi:hypothetical protein